MLRQFHQEGFVNQFAMTPAGEKGTLVFESEALENIPPAWKARETYDVISPDEFVETFELATTGALRGLQPHALQAQAFTLSASASVEAT